MTPSARSAKPDAVLSAAAEIARAALSEVVDAAEVGEHTGFRTEGERVGTHYFEARRLGYVGWRWSVTLTRASRQRTATVDEMVLLPGPEALMAPEWVPWKQRIEPADLGPGDLLPTDDNDPRLVPGYTTGDAVIDDRSVRAVCDEVELGREQVLSLEGRDAAAERWYDGDRGPQTPLAEAAPAPCGTCGYLTRLAGPLSTVFGVCANENSPDDGRVVSFDHGCGAHSSVRLSRAAHAQALPAPVFDTLGYDDIENF
ncbi:MAG: DUF3027 domain-containing protein [Propionibacteriales bacterium]|nr:DUF3027 domain-containing protein [Propionibacteriales bacterium]